MERPKASTFSLPRVDTDGHLIPGCGYSGMSPSWAFAPPDMLPLIGWMMTGAEDGVNTTGLAVRGLQLAS